MTDKLDDAYLAAIGVDLSKLPPPKVKPPGKPDLLEIVRFPHPCLEQVADLVPEARKDEVITLAYRMLDAMLATGIGWGLAANQVAIPWRMFVMQVPNRYATNPNYLAPLRGIPHIFVNPVILEVSETTVPLNEGCLSFPGVTERIERPETIKLAWTNMHDWQTKVAIFDQWEARVIQHEVDHLNGKNLIDHLSPVAQKKMRKRAIAGRRL